MQQRRKKNRIAMLRKLSFRNQQLAGLMALPSFGLGFGNNSKVKQINLSCLLSQNVLTLISFKVRVIIDELLFTNEGYTRAKNISISNYGKTSKVANTYVQDIISFSHIKDISLYKMHEFIEKLLGSAQLQKQWENSNKSRDMSEQIW